MKIIGVDWGKKTIGLAISQSGVIARELQEMDTSVAELVKFIIAEKIDKVVLGVPTTPEGKTGPQVDEVYSFGDEIAQASNIPIEYEDEAFTTDESQRLGGSHSLAARLILEQYLSRKP